MTENTQVTPEQHIQTLEAKIADYKVRIFDLAEQIEEISNALQGQQKQTQEFVSAVMVELGMELTDQVLLTDVIAKLKEALVEEALDVEVTEVTEDK